MVGLFGAIDRDVIHGEANFAHVDCDRCRAVADLTGHDSAECIDSESIVLHFANVVEIAREDAEAVAALFGFAAVWIHDAQAEVGFLSGEWPVEVTIGAEPEIAVADAHGVLLVGHLTGVFRIEDEVVVPECMVFCEFHNV